MVYTLHSLRAEAELWDAAMAKARSEGRTLTDVIKSALAEYVGHPAPPPSRRRAQKPSAVPEPRPAPAPAPAPARRPASRSASSARDEERCPHPRARITKGLCNACGQGGL